MAEFEIEIQDEAPIQVEINIDENASQTAIDAAAAAQAILILIQSYMNLLDQANRFTLVNGFSKAGQDITILANWAWLLESIGYHNAAGVTLNFPLCAAGKNRIDLIVATSANTFVRIPGAEYVGTAFAPAKPVNTLLATFVKVTDATVSDPVVPATNSFRGTFGSEGDLETLVTDPLYGHFAVIFSDGISEFALHNGNTWKYFNIGPIPAGKLQLKAKGYQGGVENTGSNIEPGDMVEGYKDNTEYWNSAIFLGGDSDQDRANYEVISSSSIPEL